MANEVLVIPEHCLAEVIAVIRKGLNASTPAELRPETWERLSEWCDEEEAYLARMEGSGV